MVCIDARGNVTACQKPLSLQQLFQLYYEAGFRGDALQQIVAHTMVESSGIPNASYAGAGTATGLLQWEPETWAGYGGGALSNRLDPVAQARVAFQAWQRSGFSDWTCAGCEPGWSSSGWAGWKQRVQQAFAAWSPGTLTLPSAGPSPVTRQPANTGPSSVPILSGVGAAAGSIGSAAGAVGGTVGGAAGSVGGGISNLWSGVTNVPGAIQAGVTSVELGARRALFVVLGLWLAMLGLMLLVMSSPTAKKAATTVAKVGL